MSNSETSQQSQIPQQQPNLGPELSQTDAIKVLIRAAQVAQEKGAYSLQEASLIHQAVSTFMVNPNQQSESEENKTDSAVNNVAEVNDQ